MSNELWTMRDIAEYADLHYATVRRLRAQGKLPQPKHTDADGVTLWWDAEEVRQTLFNRYKPWKRYALQQQQQKQQPKP